MGIGSDESVGFCLERECVGVLTDCQWRPSDDFLCGAKFWVNFFCNTSHVLIDCVWHFEARIYNSTLL